MRRAGVIAAAAAAAVIGAGAETARAQQPQIRLRSSAVALAGATAAVHGTVTPYVPGQQVTVRLYRGTRKLRAVTRAILPAAGGASGTFAARLPARRAGRLTVRASHRATPQMATAVAAPVRVRVLRTSAAPGSRGATVRLVQRRLAARGYPVGRRGLFDARTARGVLTFRKVSGLVRAVRVDRAFLRRLLAGGGRFRVRFPKHGHHVEADLRRQVLALVDGARVRRIYPISSGAPATPTVLGSFRVYRKQPGINQKGMVDSSYFVGGYAIHGYVSVPDFPDSHGCLRVPVPEARRIYDWVRMGDRVDVYRRS